MAGTVAIAAVAAGTYVIGGTGGDPGAADVAAPGGSTEHRPGGGQERGPVTSTGSPGEGNGTSSTAPSGPSARPSGSPAGAAGKATPTPTASTASTMRAGAGTPTPGARRTTAAPAPAVPEQGAPEATPRTAPQGGSGGGTAAVYAERVVALANAERAKAGCPSLRVNGRLQAAAQGHADDMSARDYYEHDTPEGRDAGDRIEAAGYNWRTWAENIHRGPKDPATAMRDWMNSPGHRKNILNCAFKDIGVGVNLRSNGPWWVQNFGATG
ncbi:CAP domain-containing protein [Streptomyces sp. NPDC047928]|uniref:CAP domain-containing protein n=1 Tax=unclassified Streptomyces TaxID=2593676 RepID=UPI00371E93B5